MTKGQSSEKAKIRAGVIGCGAIAQFHFAGLASAGATVTWVADLHAEASRPWAEKFGARQTTDYRDVVAALDVDVVFVLTHSRHHKAICLAAIAAGKAVVCEKTLAENADDALEIVRAAEAQGTIFFTSYMKRFIPAAEKMRELLPGCGTILASHVRAYQSWGDCWNPSVTDEWFCTPSDGSPSLPRRAYGGGILTMGGSHLLDLIGFLLGRPHRVYAVSASLPGRDHDEHTSALLETGHGRVHLDLLAHPFTKTGFLRDGWDEQFEIIGDRGTLHLYSANWNEGDRKASLLVHHDRGTGVTAEHRFDPICPFTRAVEFYLRQIEARQQGPLPRSTGYDVDELIATLQRSVDEQRALEVVYRFAP